MKNAKDKLINSTKGITLIALSFTIMIIVLLVGITINILLNEDGLIAIALKSKKDYENAKYQEQILLSNISGNQYVSQNGKLSVNGGHLVNQNGNPIVLRGMSAGNGSGINSLTEKYYNENSLTSLKKWGANVFRIPVDTHPSYKGYVGLSSEEREVMIERVCEIADICIDLDMYVIIDWHTLKEGNPNIYLNEAKEFFTIISERYKDVPNVLYEICNEPHSATWQELKNYSNEIIPIIRNQNNDALIIMGTPEWSHNIDEVINNELDYNNIMYTFHMYADSLNINHMERLTTAINNNIPVFVTEWGSAPPFTLNGFFLETSNMITNYMKSKNISWCNWNMTAGKEALALVQYGKWDDSLNDNILSESGKYVKKLFQNIQMEDYAIMMDRKDDYAFWVPSYRNNITTIIVEDKIDNEKISNSINSWDITYMEGTKKVIAYIENDLENQGQYILYISGNGGVCASPNSNNLFSYFSNLKKVDFSKLNTSSVYNMGGMFAGNFKLEQINLANFNTSNVYQMDYMFYNCNSLREINISSFNTIKVTNVFNMFSNLTSIETINLSNATFDAVLDSGNYNEMFTNIKNNPTIIVKDNNAQTFIQNRLSEVGKTAIIQIK